MYSCQLLYTFCFCLVHIISVLYCAHLYMNCSLNISNFLEEISSLSHSIIFLYFFALITEEGFFIFPCYSLKLYLQMDVSFLFSFAFSFSSFLSSLLGLLRQPFCFFAFLCLGILLITASWTMSETSILSSSGTLSTRSNPLNLFVTSTIQSKGIWFRSYENDLVISLLSPV